MSIVLFDIDKFEAEMQKRVCFFNKCNQTTKAIAYDSAAEFAQYCILHGYDDSIELSVSNINKAVKTGRTMADEMSKDFNETHGIGEREVRNEPYR